MYLIIPLVGGCTMWHGTVGTGQHKEDAGVGIVRFNATLNGSVPPRDPDDRYHPAGVAVPAAGSDPVLGPGRAAAYVTVIESNVDGKGGFTDQGTLEFAGGELRFRGMYPTHNENTVVDGVFQTVMVEKIVGGSGSFEHATGYFLLNSTLEMNDFKGSLNGIVFLKTK